MTGKMLPPTQSAVDEAALEGAQLAQQLGLQSEDKPAKRITDRRLALLNSITLLSTVSFYAGPLVAQGWKK